MAGPATGPWRVLVGRPHGDVLLWALEDLGATVHASEDRWYVATRQTPRSSTSATEQRAAEIEQLLCGREL